MSVPTSYPGVYISEFTPGAPIQGVGTSTAAFLGPCQDGEPGVPTRLTSWDRFTQIFGEEPVPNRYLWYAVRGYFENGGADCYVTRVSTATYDELKLDDRAGESVFTIRARRLGVSDPAIGVAITDDNVISAAEVFRHEAPITGMTQTTIALTSPAHAPAFRPGDRLTWEGINAALDQPVIARVEGQTLRLVSALSQDYSPATVRLADLSSDDKTFRMQVTTGGIPASGQILALVQDGTTAHVKVAGVIIENIAPDLTTYRITTAASIGVDLELTDPVTIQSFEFRITVTLAGQSNPIVYDQLGMAPEHPRYYASVVNNGTGPIVVVPETPPNATPPPENLPATMGATALSGGTADTFNPQASHYVEALGELTKVRDVNQVLVPDCSGNQQVQIAVMGHCEGLQDRFAVLDSRLGAEMFTDDGVTGQLAGLKDSKGYGALYYPWLLVPPAKGDEPVLVPPSGHVAGIYARTDTRRGVHKAPAGNEAGISGALGLERTMTDTDQGILNLQGVNVIRVFSPGARPVLWGARTTATDLNWQYVNIRRLFIFLEQSLQEGLRWVVFEPNNQGLWMKVRRTVTDFLNRVWRDGALFGGTPEDAFYVRIDEALNPFSEQALGRLNIEIGVRPSYPAEFVIVRIGIWPGGSDVSEG